MRCQSARGAIALVSAGSIGMAALSCSLIYGLGGNVGPLSDAAVADARLDVDAGMEAPHDGGPDGALDGPSTNWCATHAVHFFCEDFDETASPAPDGFTISCGNPTLAIDAGCESPPNCLAATNGGCIAIARNFAAPGHGKVTVNLWLRLDAHDTVNALNKIVDLEFVAPEAGGAPYTVGLTDRDSLYLFYIANDGDADNTPFTVNASAPGTYSISFTVDLDARMLTGTVDGTPASRPLGSPIPSSGQVQSITLNVGIPASTVNSGESLHVDDVTLDFD